MAWVTVFLWANGLVFVGYGLACVAFPALPADYAGFALGSTGGTVEITAMYGGLQAGFGALILVGARDVEQRRGVLLAMLIVIGSLAAARVIGMILHGTSPYNLAAGGYEIATALLALIALRSRPGAAEQPA